MNGPDKRRVLLYALGNGAGHLVRALAIARHLRRLDIDDCTIIANSRFASFAHDERVPTILVSGDRDSPAGPSEVLRSLAEVKAEILVVDTFPEGFFGEIDLRLPSIPAKKVFVARSRRLPVSDLAAYDLVVDAEVTCPPHRNVVATGPILIRDTSELKTRSEARAVLQCPRDARLVLCLHAGFRGEAEKLFRLAAKAARMLRSPNVELRFITLDPEIPADLQGLNLGYFPAMELLPAADVVVAAAGYNTFYETRAVGVPTILIPLARPIDDQLARASSHALVARSPQQLLDHLRLLLASPPEKAPPGADYQGAARAAEAIAQLLA